MRVRLTKIGINPDSDAPQSKTVEEYLVDQERGSWGQFLEGKSPPVDYYVEGEPLSVPCIGRRFSLDRDNRNGVKVRGLFQTSEIVSIKSDQEFIYFTTENSLYILQEI